MKLQAGKKKLIPWNWQNYRNHSFIYFKHQINLQTETSTNHFQFSKLSPCNPSPPSALGNDWCPLQLLIIWSISMTTPLGLQTILKSQTFEHNIIKNKDHKLALICNILTWIMIAALVRFLNLNSLWDAIALKPVCKTSTDNRRPV